MASVIKAVSFDAAGARALAAFRAAVPLTMPVRLIDDGWGLA